MNDDYMSLLQVKNGLCLFTLINSKEKGASSLISHKELNSG